MKKLLAALFVLLISAIPASSQQVLVRVAAVVNDDMISVYDLETRLRLVLISTGIPDTPENRRRETPTVLRQLINETIQLQEARRLNLTVSAEEMQDAIRRVERSNGMGEGELIRFLQRNDIPLSTYLQQLRATVAWNKVISRRIAPQVRVTDEEVQEVAQRLEEQGDTLRYSLSEIFLPVDSADQEDRVRQTAERLMKQIERGIDFASLARQYSQSSTASVGGDMGALYESQITPALRPAVRQMRSGQVMGPIRTVSGYYILFLRARRSLTEGTPDDTLVTLGQVVMPITEGRTQRTVTARLREFAEQAEGCDQFVDRVRGVGGRGQIQEDVIISRLPSGIRRMIDDLSPGQITGPLPADNAVGIYMLCRRKAPGLPTEAQIRRTLASQKVDALERRYLRDLRREASVEIRI